MPITRHSPGPRATFLLPRLRFTSYSQSALNAQLQLYSDIFKILHIDTIRDLRMCGRRLRAAIELAEDLMNGVTPRGDSEAACCEGIEWELGDAEEALRAAERVIFLREMMAARGTV